MARQTNKMPSIFFSTKTAMLRESAAITAVNRYLKRYHFVVVLTYLPNQYYYVSQYVSRTQMYRCFQ